MKKCRVCGKLFALKKESKYEINAGGALNAFHSLLSTQTVLECFDCPKCGCQNVVNERIMKRGQDGTNEEEDDAE